MTVQGKEKSYGGWIEKEALEEKIAERARDSSFQEPYVPFRGLLINSIRSK